MAMFKLLIVHSSIILAGKLYADNLLEESAKRQIELTQSKTLDNKVVLVQRKIPGSEIAHLEINFLEGQADLTEDQKAINSLAFDVLPMASAKFKKEEIFAIAEKNAIAIQCAGGIESSSCQFETVIENFDKGFDILTSTLTKPLFNEEDILLSKERRTAVYQQDIQNPESYVNTLVNSIFYPKGHPYRHLPTDAVNQLSSIKKPAINAYYKNLLTTANIQAVYVGPQLSKSRLAALESFLGQFASRRVVERNVESPIYNKSENFVFEHRPIPTAYIRGKFNAPGATDKDAATARVLFEILSEELHEEIRTKRSLSYAIFGMTLQLQKGIGVVHASTSKPKETIETMAQVIKKIKDSNYSKEKLAEYKNVFTTSHYLSLETHNSFAGSLATVLAHFGDANELYKFPAKIEAVTSQDVQRLAKEIFTKFRVAVIYDKDKFQSKWAEPLTSL
jgi:predicted Zn-dependent peptidase